VLVEENVVTLKSPRSSAPHCLSRDQSVLVLIDLQTRLVPAIGSCDALVDRAGALLKVAGQVGVPAVITEHCPTAIGGTLAPLLAIDPEVEIVSKVHFAATAEGRLNGVLGPIGRKHVVVGGTEAHVCVLQTVLGLIASGYHVWVVADACGSRKETDRLAANDRMAAAGARLVTTEMVLFEWLERGDTDLFRAILPIIKDLP